MVAETIAFALFALVTVGSALGVVLMEDVWHSALLLGVALLSVAVHYVMLQAEFLAAMQILVYVGGVLIRRGGVEADAPTDSQTDVDTEVDA